MQGFASLSNVLGALKVLEARKAAGILREERVGRKRTLMEKHGHGAAEGKGVV